MSKSIATLKKELYAMEKKIKNSRDLPPSDFAYLVYQLKKKGQEIERLGGTVEITIR